MGADIHMYSESKVNNVWVADHANTCMNNIDIGRDYYLFGFLNSVGTTHPDALQDWEFPTDASPQVNQIFQDWGSDAHSPNFITIKALSKRMTAMLLKNDPNNARILTTLAKIVQDLPVVEGASSQRLVFWFDN